MRHPLTLALTVVLAAPAVAQTAGTVQEVTVVGTSDLLTNFLRATLSVQAGAPLSSVNLRQVEQEVLASGYFKSAVAELRSVAGRDTLVITVVPNPTIKDVTVSGLTFLPADGFKKSVADLLNIAPGATLNNARIEEAKDALASNYQGEGYPFAPSISSDVKTEADGTVTVNFVVDETAPISRVEVEGVTLLPASTVTAIFKPLYDAKRFTPEAYYAAVQGLQQAYDEAGYLQAGVNTQTTALEGGVLKVRVIEGKVVGVDLSDLNNPQVTLQTQPGQPISLARLQADVRTLANQTGQPVGFALRPNPQNPAEVTVLFGSAGVASGPVKTIAVQGNALVPTATLLAAVKTKVGDVYSPQLAQEDFLALRDAYRKAGYEISTRDAITFENGALTFNIREVRVAGYELQWQGNHKTNDRVVLRELPEAGRAFNRDELNAALGRIARLGFVRVVSEQVRSDPANPENITYVLGVTETTSGIPVSLGLTYDSFAGGFGGEAAYTNNNVFGLGHNFTVTLGGQQNEAGQNLVGNVAYTIPWLDLDFLDFRKVPTTLSVSAGTGVTGNQPLFTKPTDTPANVDTGWDYTTRTTSFSVSAGRNLTKNLYASVGFGVGYNTYYLEPLQKDDKNTVTYKDASGAEQSRTFAEGDVKGLVPTNSLLSAASAGLSYDSTDNGDFPGSGARANLGVRYKFGNQNGANVRWTELESGASTYFGFGRTLEKSLGVTNKQQVFAVRANAGTTLGLDTAPVGTGYSVGGGSSASASRHIRGLADGELFGPNYLTASAEYRYDFGLKAGIAQGLYGVVFADAGSAWGSSANPNFNLKYGVGAGVQLNLGIGGTLLPSLRFDYGFSPQTGKGKFYFRLGNFW
ncbi:BamA/OMP85 family outer membrane protein [Deinococcus multiflagellatus]|uniref:Outer membrane protein assembly factor n=1 Tax=Deinococcus multiflagellatus TaxID=1656887 RepID=A0ABW1ZJ66_9DEIO|nr:POTRA domain-containing protein [Deinococcus multiflagellatus]MBZ9714314.1 BamA/TamA family outer membrane protein [Deinococcus multiflagellatus]